MLKKVWVPAIVIPVLVCAVLFLMIVGIGELLLFMSTQVSGNAAIAVGVGLLALITLVSWILARRFAE
ncbi:MAG: hypothetical protein QJR03_07975 [Sphaerobacter sp.]|nr:hypothetical protein [Sphaerobacter sp.]